MTQSVTVLYFSWLRERVGVSQQEVLLPGDIATVDALVDHLATQGPGYAAAFQNRRSIRCAVNQEFATPSASLRPGDEVAFFPPVTGG
jgi:molybdopterin synthase sulfur carrier subunit